MKSSALGSKSNVSVENITPFSIWISDGEKEYAIPFSEFPCLKKASVEELMHPALHHGFHLCWEKLDIDIDLRSLSHLEDFPLYFESKKQALHAVAEDGVDYAVKKSAGSKRSVPAGKKRQSATRKKK
jgi:hypothetical protein